MTRIPSTRQAAHWLVLSDMAWVRRIRGRQKCNCEAIRLICLDEETRAVRGGLVTLKAIAIPAPVFLSSIQPDSLNANFFMTFRPRTNANREHRVRHHPFLPCSGTTGRAVATPARHDAMGPERPNDRFNSRDTSPGSSYRGSEAITDV